MANILVIDDSPSVLALLESLLSAEGHQVSTTTSGKQGLQWIAQGTPDLVVTDMYMPEQDGMEVIREAHRLQPNLPLVAMSAKSGPLNLFAAARMLGAFSTLQKPFSRDELLAVVSTALTQPRRRGSSTTTPAPDSNSKPSP